ncbi:MAG: hypothetical protein MJZ32_08030 [Bacteroidaceae bacterium]|nr:hypothetical protein [Bacteroidaceae bacterium]
MTGSVNFSQGNMQLVLNQIPIEYTTMAIDYLNKRRQEAESKAKKIVLSPRILEHMSKFADPSEDVKSLKAEMLLEEYKQ